MSAKIIIPATGGQRKVIAVDADRRDSAHRFACRMIWLYFWLLIFEGALRKWVLPQFSTYLLLIRDPVLLLSYIAAMRANRFPWNGWIQAMLALGFITFGVSIVGVLAGGMKSTLFVCLYGLRTNFLHLPLIFVMAACLGRHDAERIGKAVLLLAIPMALLVWLQYRSDSSAWINAAAGGEAGQISAAVGVDKIRPPGTFSFINGLVAFNGLVAAFLLSHFLRPIYARWLAVAGLLALLPLTFLALSRSSIFTVLVVLISATIAPLISSHFGMRSLRLGLIVAVALFGLSLWSPMREAAGLMQQRIEDAEGVQVGIVGRFFNDLSEPVKLIGQVPFFGYGLGLGTNAGAQAMTGERAFLLAESEWSRILLEVGAVLGVAYIALRVGMVILLARVAVHRLRLGMPLPFLLCTASALSLMQGQFGQTTALGFAVFGAGLCLAAAQRDKVHIGGVKRPALNDAVGLR